MKVLLCLTCLHFLVDGVCGAVLGRYAYAEPQLEPIVRCFLIYTLLAFGLQGPVGWLLDKMPHRLQQILLGGTLLLELGTLPQLPVYVQVLGIGFGNCLFHVTGGKYVLQRYATYKELGCFVASGALGIAWGLHSAWVWQFAVAALLVTIFTYAAMTKAVPSPVPQECVLAWERTDASKLVFCAVLLLGCVILRGFGSGSDISSYALMTLPCIFALGKLCGGLVCDKIGYRRTVLLVLALGFLGIQLQSTDLGVLFVFACNMTMPLTLRLAHFCLPAYPGLMFGLAATCLVPGALSQGMLSVSPQLILALQFISLTLAGFILLGAGFRRGA